MIIEQKSGRRQQHQLFFFVFISSHHNAKKNFSVRLFPEKRFVSFEDGMSCLSVWCKEEESIFPIFLFLPKLKKKLACSPHPDLKLQKNAKSSILECFFLVHFFLRSLWLIVFFETDLKNVEKWSLFLKKAVVASKTPKDWVCVSWVWFLLP